MKVIVVSLFAVVPSGVLCAQTQVVIETSYGAIPITLYDDRAPLTVANFLGYVERGDYEDVIFHRHVEDFVLQAGGFRVTDASQPNLVEAITAQAPVVNEPGISNVKGTLAMAKLGGDPDSATNQWFINLEDNSGSLNSQNGGFTVFGEVTDMTVVDEIAARPVAHFTSPFDDIPLKEYDPGTTVERDDLIVITGLSVVPEPSSAGLLGLVSVLICFARKR
ncbi:MAG: peptidylprolyl isomerase [Verrucomicrobiaceae bacterium]